MFVFDVVIAIKMHKLCDTCHFMPVSCGDGDQQTTS